MIDLNDPDMKEIIIEFCDESDALLEELRDILDDFEDDPENSILLEKYGQTVDRIMGAAKTMGLEDLGHLCQMGKIIGYKGSQAENKALQELSGGVLYDLCDLLEVILGNIREGKDQKEHDFNLEAFKGRLEWLAGKFKHIERASCDIGEEPKAKKATKTTAELDRLISQFGKAS